jgi:hypothetical protein
MKQYTLSEMEDKYIGKTGTPERDEYEYELLSKLENHTNRATLETIFKIFKALKADIQFNVRLENRPVHMIG